MNLFDMNSISDLAPNTSIRVTLIGRESSYANRVNPEFIEGYFDCYFNGINHEDLNGDYGGELKMLYAYEKPYNKATDQWDANNIIYGFHEWLIENVEVLA